MALENKQICNITALCLIWYVISSSNNVIGKMVLSTFPYPLTVTMVQLTSITLYSGPFFNMWGIRRYTDISWKYYLRLIVPLALGKFFSSVTSHISIWKVPVSYAHTGKHFCHTNRFSLHHKVRHFDWMTNQKRIACCKFFNFLSIRLRRQNQFMDKWNICTCN